MLSSAMLVQLLASLGAITSILAIRVVEQNEGRRQPRAWCDLASFISCTKALLSPHGRMLRVHNAWIGLVFYLTVFLLAARGLFEPILVLTAIACLVSLYLAYVSYVEMRTACVVCTTVYILNGLLLLLSYRLVFSA